MGGIGIEDNSLNIPSIPNAIPPINCDKLLLSAK
jgi:hypothetical protein